MSFGQFLVNLAIAGVKSFNSSSPGPIGGGTPGNVNASNLVVKSLGWSATGASPSDVGMYRPAANKLYQRNGFNPQTMQLMYTYTDDNNYQGVSTYFDQYGTAWVSAVAVGTGANRGLNFNANALQTSFFQYGVETYRLGAGALQPMSNGIIDLGALTQGFRRLYLDYTNITTFVANPVINKVHGRVMINGLASSIVVTNNLVTANTHVFAIASSAGGGAAVSNVVPAAGSFTINLSGTTTGAMTVDFFVLVTDL